MRTRVQQAVAATVPHTGDVRGVSTAVMTAVPQIHVAAAAPHVIVCDSATDVRELGDNTCGNPVTTTAAVSTAGGARGCWQ